MKNLKPQLVSSSLCLIFLFFSTNSCGKKETKNFIKAKYQTTFQIADSTTPLWINQQKKLSKKKGETIWKRGNFALIKHETPALTLLNLAHQQKLFMVSFASNSLLANELFNSDKTLLWHSGKTSRDKAEAVTNGFALVEIGDSKTLNEIATAAHSNSLPGGLSCGNLELVGGLSLIEDTSVELATYQQNIKLTEVESLLNQVQKSNLQTTVQALQDLGTRHYAQSNANDGVTLIKNQMNAANNGKIPGFVIKEISNTDALFEVKQKSLVATIPGQDPTQSMVIIGAHLDTINADLSNKNTAAPGADDDASGIAVLVELIRVIAENNLSFTRTIEFHAYAAEEVGLVGSQHLAELYKTENKKVHGMLQLDMVSWSVDPNDQTIHIIENDTSSSLRRSLKDLLTTYLGGDFKETELAAGTSDHKMWTSFGFRSVFPFEDPNNHNPQIHTTNDTVANINNFALAERFGKLSLAFIAHHAGLSSAAAEYQTLLAAQSLVLGSDLKIALTPIDPDAALTADDTNLIVATTTAVSSVESCISIPSQPTFCQNEPNSFQLQKTANDRNFFVTKINLALKESETRVVNGYDQNNKLIMQRVINLTKK